MTNQPKDKSAMKPDEIRSELQDLVLQLPTDALDAAHRVFEVMSDLAYIKDKGARDLLVELGMVEDVVALDIRVQNVLEALGFRTSGLMQGAGYNAVEETLRAALPHLGVSSLAHLDRILFGHTKEIIAAIQRTLQDNIK